jgi:thioredoxin-dependent peroxiredoxin
MASLAAGDNAPDFELQTDSMVPFRLSEHRGEPIVLFFYPQDGTEGCTVENIEFTHMMPQFEALGVKVVGISPDTVETHCKFRDKHGLAVRLAADPDRKVIDAYGVWGPKTLYGRAFEGLIRTTFLIDADGRIAEAWTVRRIKGHAAAVLEAARKLVGGRGAA